MGILDILLLRKVVQCHKAVGILAPEEKRMVSGEWRLYL